MSRYRIDGFKVSVLRGSVLVIDDVRADHSDDTAVPEDWVRFNTTEPLHFVVGDAVIRVQALAPVGDDEA